MASPSQHKQLLQMLYSQDIVYSRIFGALSTELSKVLARYKSSDPNNPWSRNKALEKEVNLILEQYQSLMFNSIQNYNTTAWALSDKHNDGLFNDYTKGIELNSTQKQPLLARNKDALTAFLNRRSNGLDLSDRVWKLTNNTKSQLETFLAAGLASGRSADKLATDLKQFLNNPDKRFRRIRDPRTGKLILSQPGDAYHPGRGVYRSSYKNALRLARNEINIAYRTADHERRQNLPFVLGIKVNLSPSHPRYDICDELQGEYPKEFLFKGWHTNCLCFTTTKLLSRQEFIGYMNGGTIPPSKVVNTIPSSAASFLNVNSDKLKGLKSKPYFIADNFKNTRDGFALKKSALPLLNNTKEELPQISAPTYVPETISNYEKALDITIDRAVFEFLNKSTPLNPKGAKGKGGFYDPSKNLVFIPVKSQRNTRSKWHSKSVIYHEYGHAADWQNGYRRSVEVNQLMERFRKKFRYGKKVNYRSIDRAIIKRSQELFQSKDYDGLEKLGALGDTLMSLNPAYGFGHTKAYFKKRYMREAEFIAHCFENKFLGNDIFKEMVPELYEAMIQLVDEFKAKLK